MEGDPYHFYPIQTAFGGYVFARDDAGNYDPTQVGVGDEGSVAAAQWFERMVTEGLQPPAVSWDIQHEMFESGESAMQITGPWSYQRTVDSGIPFQICHIPTATEEGRPFVGAQGFMVSAFAKDPLLPQIFLTDFVATEEAVSYTHLDVYKRQGHKDGWVKTKLKGRPLRGIYNDSMLCSEKELGISDEHEGIRCV